MKLQQLRYLMAVIESGLNMTAAAERLSTSQPGVSKQLKLLEQELGLHLFARRGKSLVGLTPEGEEIAQRAGRILQEVEAIRGLSAGRFLEVAGRLAIGTTHTQARYVLPGVIARFRDQYPEVTLDLHQGTSEQLADLAARRQVDFVIASEARHRFPELVTLPCFRWDRVVLVPRGHPLAAQPRNLTLEAIAAHPLVTYVFNFDGGSSFKEAFVARGLDPRIVFTARDADVIKTYVRLGLGIGIVAGMAHGAGADGGGEGDDELVGLDAAGLFPRCTTWIGFRRDLALRRYMYDFLRMFAAHLEPATVSKAVGCATQEEVDALLADVPLALWRRGPESVAAT